MCDSVVCMHALSVEADRGLEVPCNCQVSLKRRPGGIHRMHRRTVIAGRRN